jgi:hypothetical protein
MRQTVGANSQAQDRVAMGKSIPNVGAALLVGLLMATPALPVLRLLASGCALPLVFDSQTCRFPLFDHAKTKEPEPLADLLVTRSDPKFSPDPD